MSYLSLGFESISVFLICCFLGSQANKIYFLTKYISSQMGLLIGLSIGLVFSFVHILRRSKGIDVLSKIEMKKNKTPQKIKTELLSREIDDLGKKIEGVLRNQNKGTSDIE